MHQPHRYQLHFYFGILNLLSLHITSEKTGRLNRTFIVSVVSSTKTSRGEPLSRKFGRWETLSYTRCTYNKWPATPALFVLSTPLRPSPAVQTTSFSFLPLSPLTLTISSTIVRQYLWFVRQNGPGFQTKNAFRSTISVKSDTSLLMNSFNIELSKAIIVSVSLYLKFFYLYSI